jgi:hypothetical protein
MRQVGSRLGFPAERREHVRSHEVELLQAVFFVKFFRERDGLVEVGQGGLKVPRLCS